MRILILTPSLYWPKEFRVRNCSKEDKVSKRSKFILGAPCVSVYEYITVKLMTKIYSEICFWPKGIVGQENL